MKYKWTGILSLLMVMNTYANTDATNNWSGIYIGPNLGGVFNSAQLNASNISFGNWDGICNTSADFSSIFLGGETGAMYQLHSNIVLGLEGDFTYHFSPSGQGQCTCDLFGEIYDRFTFQNKYQGSLRGRLGYALPYHILPYIAAGVSFANLNLAYENEGGDSYSTTSTEAGWVAGAGLEWAFTSNWSVRLEYYYGKYNDLSMSIPTVYDVYDPKSYSRYTLSNNNARLAFNYWFR